MGAHRGEALVSGERVLVAGSEQEIKQLREDDVVSGYYVVNVGMGVRVVEGMRVESIDITPQAVQHSNFYEVYQSLRRSQIMTVRR